MNPTDKKHVFLSYSRRNADQAGQIDSVLRSQGFVVWRDVNELRGGQDWLRTIQEAIGDASAVVILWSKEAEESKWVGEETRLAIGEEKNRAMPIIPVRLDETPLSKDLDGKQAISLAQGDRAKQRLIESLPSAIRRQKLGFRIDKPVGEQVLPDSQSWDVDGIQLVAVPLLRSGHCMAFVVAEPKTIVGQPKRLQLCLRFTRPVIEPFIPDVYRTWRQETKPEDQQSFVGLLVTGPILLDKEYRLDNDNSAQWNDAVDTSYEAVLELSRSARPTLQVYSLATVALTFALGLKFFRFWHVQLYNFLGSATYKRVMEILPDAR